MVDPKSLQVPNTYEGEFWDSNGGYNNANVFNHCFYLLTQGGSGTNDNGDDYTVAPISRAEASAILVRAMSVYMTPNTNFADTRKHGIQSCIDLYGTCSYQEIQFTNACYAIGVGEEYVGPPITDIQFTGTLEINEEISFTSNATTATSWEWNFGDNTNSVEEMPNHIYQSGGTYEVTLAATYAGGCIMYDTIKVDVAGATGILEAASRNVLLYPNPVKENMFLEFAEGNELKELRLINTLGQTFPITDLNNISDHQYEIQLDHLPAGIYLIELVFTDNFSMFEKIYLQSDTE